MAQKRFRPWLHFRLAALFWLLFVASLASLWLVQRQRRIERNASLDQQAAQAKRLHGYVPFEMGVYDSRPEYDREEVATRWLIEIARRKGLASEEEDALQKSAAWLKNAARKVRILWQNGSKGGEEHEVTFVQARQAQVQVALAQLQGNSSEIRDAMAEYVHCLRRYRDELAKLNRPHSSSEIRAEIDLAGARVVQAELNRDPQMQAAALREQLAAVQEFAHVLSNGKGNALGVVAADYAAAGIQVRLTCILQDEASELAAWQKALAQLRKLHAAAVKYYDGQSYLPRGAGNEVDWAVRLPQPNMLIDFKPCECLTPQAQSLKLAVLTELADIAREAAWRIMPPDEERTASDAAVKGKREDLDFNRYWDGLKALVDFQLEDAAGSAAR
jgi:hypothetical protein